MQDDLDDAVTWAVKENLADPKRVAIVGRGYGGYAALMGLVSTPEVFRCGVSAFAPVDLGAYVKLEAPGQRGLAADFQRRVGDLTDAADRARLEQASPLGLAERLAAPVLVALDAQDPQLIAAKALLGKSGAPWTLATYDGARAENAVDFDARVEGFLAACIGGRAEPMPKEGKIAGASVQVSQNAKVVAPVKR
jgi:dipeptidyl aminopeptidase/acylaminoacyl peptidase